MEERDKNELISVLVTSAEIPEREGSISMENCPSTSHTC